MNADPRSQNLLNQLGDVPTIRQHKLAVFVAPLEKGKFKKRRGRGGANNNDPNNLVKEHVEKDLPERKEEDEPKVQVDAMQKVTNWLDKLKQDTLLPPTKTSLPTRHKSTPNKNKKKKQDVPSVEEKEAHEQRQRLIAHHGGSVAYINKVRSGEINVHTKVPEGDIAQPMVVDSHPTHQVVKKKKGSKAKTQNKKQSATKPEPMEVDQKAKTQNKKQSVTKPEPIEVDKKTKTQQPSSLITKKTPDNKRHTKTLGKHTKSDMYELPNVFGGVNYAPMGRKKRQKADNNQKHVMITVRPLHPKPWRY
ncbi:hypothetical protein BC832DRAFT_594421 [Gaertneriomyces semiglobifer]|nr:hypothetical protein BC832DRAFT_594421 [Gaertneriomyces semiglobifer]